MNVEVGNRLSITAEFLAELEDRRNPDDWEGDPRFTGDFIGWDEPDCRLLIAGQPFGDYVLISCHSAAGENFGESLFQRAIVEEMRLTWFVNDMQARCEDALNKGENWTLTSDELRAAYEFGEREFQGVDLSGAYLWRACLREGDFRGAKFEDADLSDADLSGANFEDADLSGANFEDANLENSDLRNTDLRGANLAGAYLVGAKLEGANLEGAILDE